VSESLQVERDGRFLRTFLHLPANGPPWPLVVFAHGWVGHPRKFTRLFGRWVAAGYAVAAPAFPLTNDEASAPDFDDVASQPADVAAVLDALTQDARFDGGRVAAAGFSLGAVTTLGFVFGSQPDPRVSAAIAISGHEPWFDTLTPRACPLLVVHGRLDRAVPYEGGVAVYRRALPPKALLSIALPRHQDHVEDDPPTAGEEVVDEVTTAFLDRVLRRAPAPAPDVGAAIGRLENDGIW